MKTNHIIKISSVVMLTALLGLFTHCSGPVAEIKESRTVPYKAKDQGQIIQEMSVSTGIKNFEQIFMTMATLTGIDPMSGNVQSAFKEASSSLPTDNDIKVFSSSNQVAITKIASEFCNSLVTSTTARSAFYPGYNFSLRPKEGLTQPNRDLIIEQTLSNIWGEIATEEEKSHAYEELNLLIDDLLQDENMTSTTTNLNVIKGVCTAVLSTAHVTLL